MLEIVQPNRVYVNSLPLLYIKFILYISVMNYVNIVL